MIATQYLAFIAARRDGGDTDLSSDMAQYFFRISDGDYAGASDHATEFESRDVAWAEMTKVCGNFLGSISRNMKQNSEWHMELLDEGRKPVFRIRLVAESVD